MDVGEKENISNEIKFKLAKNVARGVTCDGGRGMIMSLLKMSSGNNNNNSKNSNNNN